MGLIFLDNLLAEISHLTGGSRERESASLTSGKNGDRMVLKVQNIDLPTPPHNVLMDFSKEGNKLQKKTEP